MWGGASAWAIELPDGDVTAFVRGPGAPHVGVRRGVLLPAENRFLVCGAFVGTVGDGACGVMPLFEATRFRAEGLITRYDCDDLLSECAFPGGYRTRPGPPDRLGPDDGAVACDADRWCTSTR